jgi:putative transposase
MKYAFIDEQRGLHKVTTLCRVLEVKRGGYYAYRNRGVSKRTRADEALTVKIRAIFKAHRGRYGADRIADELRDHGVRCSARRVARLMRTQQMKARARKLFKVTTKIDESKLVAPDLVQRRFWATRPNALWTADITYIWTREGWLYLAIVLDVFSRRIVGWATSRNIDAALVCTAMQRALAGRIIKGELIFHSDRGSQYCSNAFRDLLARHGILQSQGISCYDNAITETFFHTLKTECIFFETFHSRNEAHSILFDYIEAYYNSKRKHSALEYLSPAQFEHELSGTN